MSDYTDFLDTGDLVAGRYNKLGAPSEAPKVAGTEVELNVLKNKISSLFLSSGAEQIHVPSKTVAKQKKGKKTTTVPTLPTVNTSKAIDPEFQKYYDEPSEEVVETMQQAYVAPVTQKKIVFQNEFGSIRMEAEEVLYSNLGILIIFSNDDKLTFVPKPGQTIDFSEDGSTYTSVVFIDSLFTFGEKKIMVLFKNQQDTEE